MFLKNLSAKNNPKHEVLGIGTYLDKRAKMCYNYMSFIDNCTLKMWIPTRKKREKMKNSSKSVIFGLVAAALFVALLYGISEGILYLHRSEDVEFSLRVQCEQEDDIPKGYSKICHVYAPKGQSFARSDKNGSTQKFLRDHSLVNDKCRFEETSQGHFMRYMKYGEMSWGVVKCISLQE